MKKRWCLFNLLNSNRVDKRIKKKKEAIESVECKKIKSTVDKKKLFMLKKHEQKREQIWKSVIHMWIKIWSDCNEEDKFLLKIISFI